mgnify:CR=1 FL=1|jgi:SAM-dependent methyltransferase|tara:strand:+ start:883 stop:1626 length:744 start_codon:yes stop_codon:yes gene_type:complete
MTVQKFEFDGTSIAIDVEGCFEPNLTTKLMLKSAIFCLEAGKPDFKRVLELGCGSGVISAFLACHNYFDGVAELCISDISEIAVTKALSNVMKFVKDREPLKVHSNTGSGFEPWHDEKFDLIINDISAISDRVASLSNWFDFAPCNAGEDGLINTLQIMDDFSEISDVGSVLLFPLLSLSNVSKFNHTVLEKGYKIEKFTSQKWPLPPEMCSEHSEELNDLNNCGVIQLGHKFGQLIAETSIYKMTM